MDFGQVSGRFGVMPHGVGRATEVDVVEAVSDPADGVVGATAALSDADGGLPLTLGAATLARGYGAGRLNKQHHRALLSADG